MITVKNILLWRAGILMLGEMLPSGSRFFQIKVVW